MASTGSNYPEPFICYGKALASWPVLAELSVVPRQLHVILLCRSAESPVISAGYPRSVRWSGVLQAKLGEDAFVIEEGLNGRTMTATIRPVRSRIAGCSSEHVCPGRPLGVLILMLGTNDSEKMFERSSEQIAHARQG